MKSQKSLNFSSKYGFLHNIDQEYFPNGINIPIIKLLCLKKKESLFLQIYRINSYYQWIHMINPDWNIILLKNFNFFNTIYYIKSKKKKKIFQIFEKLGIKLFNQKNVAVDAIFDSISISTNFVEKLAKLGIIFNSISISTFLYPNIIKKYIGKIVKSTDNFYSALNSSVFSDGTFCYISKNITCPINLSSYFRIHNKSSGQFERTLIITEKNGEISYIEGCTAPQNYENQLHIAIVELIAFDKSKIKYSTIQNWYSGNIIGFGGIYNLVTKRGICLGKKSIISWIQIEIGSIITTKYPSCILIGFNSTGEFYSIALTKKNQYIDTGTKILHIGKHTKSKILAKSLSLQLSLNSYRGLVKISKTAPFTFHIAQCDSFLFDNTSTIFTYPYIEIFNKFTNLEHEAKISKISDELIIYLQQRGFSIEKAIDLLLQGFYKDIISVLPLEFALEANHLLKLRLNTSIG